MARRPDRWRPRRLLRRLWWGSLPLRVLVSTLGLSIAVMMLVGIILLQQATAEIVASKRQAAVTEAAGVHAFMQKQMRESDARDLSADESLSRVADLTDAQAAQYQVMIQGPVVNLRSRVIHENSVPDELRRQVQSGEAMMYVTPTRVNYLAEGVSPEPGLAIGASLIGMTGDRYPVYYVFPLTSEVRTIRSLQDAIVVTGTILVVALGLISYLVTVQIVRPVRRASTAALRIASGQLDERLRVRGTDDLASLARAMNQMARQLQQRIRELETLSSVQQRFVSDVSHELRTPLTTIKMASDLLYDARDGFEAPTKRSVELMSTEIERFELMLGDLLEISRFDAGAAVLTLDSVDLSALVAGEVASVEPMAQRMGTRIVAHYPGGTTNAEIDPRRIRRVVRNLIINAIEHAEAQPITVTVAADENAVAVTVRDLGVGFAPENATRVFERFWRADPSRNRIIGGSGLGLAIAMEDARLHRGWLDAWGCPGRGAQFRLTLPRRADYTLLASPLPTVPDGEEPQGPMT